MKELFLISCGITRSNGQLAVLKSLKATVAEYKDIPERIRILLDGIKESGDEQGISMTEAFGASEKLMFEVSTATDEEIASYLPNDEGDAA